ncbi:transposase [Paenibacillus polymyxa]|uniref:transposase n=1 Tax=Paenibacillus polymyxa TaxID=1406 RepID=UPI0004B6C0F9|nr:transposase [Paenibacillus polymyxa]
MLKEHMYDVFWHYFSKGDFVMAIKGQKFKIYTPEFKLKVVLMHLEEGLTFSQIIEKTGVKSDAQLVDWVRKYKAGIAFKDRSQKWNKKNFSSLEEENAYLKAQVEYLKKLNPNLHGEGSWINRFDTK